jgi:antibiotic biosynthesis monooxygenase (ABM) superfamily enzyme
LVVVAWAAATMGRVLIVLARLKSYHSDSSKARRHSGYNRHHQQQQQPLSSACWKRQWHVAAALGWKQP